MPGDPSAASKHQGIADLAVDKRLLAFAPAGSGLRAVLLLSLAPRVATAMSIVTVPLLVLARHQSPAVAGLCAATYGGAVAIGSPFWGRAMDSWAPLQVVYRSAAMAATALVVFLAAGQSAILLIASAGLLGLSTMPYSALMRAFWIEQVPPATQQSATYMESLLIESVHLVARLVVAATAALAVTITVSLQAVVLVLGAGGMATSRRFRSVPAVTKGVSSGRMWSALVDLPVEYATFFLLNCSLGAFSLGLVVQLEKTSPSVAAGAVATWGCGSLLGTFVLRNFVSLASSTAAAGLATAMAAAQAVTAVCHGSIAATYLSAAAAGIPIATIVSHSYDRLRTDAPADAVGQYLSWLSTASYLGTAAGSSAAGVAASAGLSAAILAAALAVACGGFALLARG